MKKAGYASRSRLSRLLKVRRIEGVTAEEYAHRLRKLLDGVIEHEKAERAARVFSAVSDPVRIKILKLLEKESMCVCELMKALNMRQSLISYHLKFLREAGLIKPVRKGKWVFYEIADKKVLRMIDKIIELA
ncbi:MAG: ArsR family transcriptional regulator [Thaumarchaeota archaeon]|nr:MAG: ArsR family transcriptional regulator [Nitrososphaerota archaeon]